MVPPGQREGAGRAHPALAFDGDVAVAWCQYGTPEELPNTYHRKEYEAIALRGSLELTTRAGGGLVEAHPQDTGGKRASASFRCDGTRSSFEDAGFTYCRPKGQEPLRDEQTGP